MKKEYLIGGVLGIVLCGIVTYAVITFMGMQDSETDQQLVQQLAPPVPLEVTVPQSLSPANVPLPDRAKGKKVTPALALSDQQKPADIQADTLTGVMITLKNGRSVIADFCRDVTGKLLCIVFGGSMEIDRQEIASIRDVKLPSISSGVSAVEPSGGKADDKKPASEKTSAAAKNGEGKLVRGLTAEQIKRLDAINERKTILQPERERLIKEREKLHADVKDMGMIYKQEQFDGIKKRIADVEEKISRFNEEVKQLTIEESSIIEALNKVK